MFAEIHPESMCCVLQSLIAMKSQTDWPSAVFICLLKSGKNKRCIVVDGNRMTDNFSREDVNDDAQGMKNGIYPNIGDITHPQDIGQIGTEISAIRDFSETHISDWSY